MKAEQNSKAELQNIYNRSRPTINAWLRFLKENYKRLAKERNDPDYLSFEQYETKQRILTPLQKKIFEKHYGEA